jgi:hypothetical protein
MRRLRLLCLTLAAVLLLALPTAAQVSVTMQDVIQLPTGQVIFLFQGGVGIEYPSLAAAVEAVNELNASVGTARTLLIAWWLARQPDGSNEALVEGKTLLWDLGNAQPIRVQ